MSNTEFYFCVLVSNYIAEKKNRLKVYCWKLQRYLQQNKSILTILLKSKRQKNANRSILFKIIEV